MDARRLLSTVLTHLRGEENELKGRLQGIMKELEVVREQAGEEGEGGGGRLGVRACVHCHACAPPSS